VAAAAANEATALAKQHPELASEIGSFVSFQFKSENFRRNVVDVNNYYTAPDPITTLVLEDVVENNVGSITNISSRPITLDYDYILGVNDSVMTTNVASDGGAGTVVTALPPVSTARGGESFACTCYDFVIEAVMMGVLCLFGFTGNTVSMICLWHDRSKTATPFLLVSLELADTLFLATVFLLRVLTSIRTFAYTYEYEMLVCMTYIIIYLH